MIRRFWRDYAARYRKWYLLGLAFLVATNLLTVAIPAFVERAIDALEESLDRDSAVLWALAVLLSGLAIIVVRTLSRTFIFNPGRTVEYRIKATLFDHLLELEQPYFDRVRPGEIISRGTNDTNSIRALIGFASLALVNTVLAVAFTLFQMLTTHPLLTLLCALPLIGATAVLQYAVRAMWRLIRELQQQIATLSDTILESYNGVAVIHAFNAQRSAQQRFDEANERMLDIGLKLTRIRSWLLPLVSVVGSLCLVVVLWAGGQMVVEGELTTGELAAFLVYVNLMVVHLTLMGWGLSTLQRGWVSLGRVYEVLDEPVRRPTPSSEMPTPTDGGYPLEVNGLTFAYPTPEESSGEPRPVLSDVTFSVRPGETLGVFGMTGSGKSTLLDLIARVYEPPPGAVSVGGRDVLTLPVEDYWQKVAYVTQEAFLFSRTIRENIAIAEARERIDHEQVVAAATDAALEEDLRALPEGLDTRVGERGITLSGGQRQRTALARAFYRPFDVLLLDDVMSAVDHETETRLIDAIYRRGQGSTMVVVSHRVSVLSRADRIVVLEGGRITATGSHQQLVADREGLYARAWRLQQAEEEAVDEAG